MREKRNQCWGQKDGVYLGKQNEIYSFALYVKWDLFKIYVIEESFKKCSKYACLMTAALGI